MKNLSLILTECDICVLEFNTCICLEPLCNFDWSTAGSTTASSDTTEAGKTVKVGEEDLTMSVVEIYFSATAVTLAMVTVMMTTLVQRLTAQHGWDVT